MLAIIGGTGLAALDGLEVKEVRRIETPFGDPSSDILLGRLGNQDVLFSSRHGTEHQFLPHEVNYRANIFALKVLGAMQIVGISAVDSLSEPIVPGELAVPNQYFDWTRGRRAPTFFGGGIAVHVSTANPVSDNLVKWIDHHAASLDMALHIGVTYACVEGPRLGTRAESHFLRQTGCHLVGMTNVPEVFWAREAQICYATIGIATDYDCWMDDPQKHVQATEIFGLYRSSLAKVQRLLQVMLADQRPTEEPEIRGALAYAMLTHDVVAAPASDGGYVLIGLSCPTPSLFEDIAWSTGAVMAQTRLRAVELGIDLFELATLHDVDEPADLVHVPCGWLQ